MTHYLASILSGISIQEVLSVVALLGFWARLERRMTRIETKIEDLPCPGKKACP